MLLMFPAESQEDWAVGSGPQSESLSESRHMMPSKTGVFLCPIPIPDPDGMEP